MCQSHQEGAPGSQGNGKGMENSRESARTPSCTVDQGVLQGGGPVHAHRSITERAKRRYGPRYRT